MNSPVFNFTGIPSTPKQGQGGGGGTSFDLLRWLLLQYQHRYHTAVSKLLKRTEVGKLLTCKERRHHQTWVADSCCAFPVTNFARSKEASLLSRGAGEINCPANINCFRKTSREWPWSSFKLVNFYYPANEQALHVTHQKITLYTPKNQSTFTSWKYAEHSWVGSSIYSLHVRQTLKLLNYETF